VILNEPSSLPAAFARSAENSTSPPRWALRKICLTRCGTQRDFRRQCASRHVRYARRWSGRSGRFGAAAAAPVCDPHRRQPAGCIRTTSAARIAASFRDAAMTFRRNQLRNGEFWPAKMWGRISRLDTEFCNLIQGAPSDHDVAFWPILLKKSVSNLRLISQPFEGPRLRGANGSQAG
jgi:hypothetical protein